MKSLIAVRYILPLLLIKVRAGFDRDIIKDSDIFNQYVLPWLCVHWRKNRCTRHTLSAIGSDRGTISLLLRKRKIKVNVEIE